MLALYSASPSSVRPFLSSSSLSFVLLILPWSAAGGEPRAGSGAASEAGGGHHARDCAGSRRLPPQRPARDLPRPGPHAPISEELLGGVGGRSAKRREEALEAGFAAVTEADGERRGGRRPPFLWRGPRAAHHPLAEVEKS